MNSKQLKIVGTKPLQTELGKQVLKKLVLDEYLIPASLAQSMTKADNFGHQLDIFIQYLDSFCHNGYWIATTDPDDESRFVKFYGTEIEDQYVSKIVNKEDPSFGEINDKHLECGLGMDAHSYLFVQELPEGEHVRRRMQSLRDEGYDLRFQVR